MTDWIPRWQPLSAVHLSAARSYLSPALARHLLSSRGQIVVTYLGDRLWPSIRHGSPLEVTRATAEPLPRGALVLALLDAIPDLLRIESDNGVDIRLRADADPSLDIAIPRHDLLGVVNVPTRLVSSSAARRRRRQLDLWEALFHSSDKAVDAADTVQAKYDVQAPFYDDSATSSVGDELRAKLAQFAPRGARLIVAGCGAGAECRDLLRDGYRVLGVDFSAEMIHRARASSPAEPALEYQLADLRQLSLPAPEISVVLFTPDVYSFIPSRRDRVASLRRLSQGLCAGGALFVSARIAKGHWPRAMLWLQWCASRADRARGWGSSHTRWIAADGALQRSFIRLFSERQLEREFAAAGLREIDRVGGWHVLQRRESLPHSG